MFELEGGRGGEWDDYQDALSVLLKFARVVTRPETLL